MNWRKSMRDRCAQVGIFLAMFASSACVGQPTYWYVDADGPGSEPWDEAYTDLQDVLTNPYLDEGDVIWVAAGTYTPTDDDDQTISFSLTKNVRMYGGFHGGQDGETDLSERDIFENVTIMSGDIDGDGLDADNSHHVVIGGSLDTTMRLDGFTITGGYCDLTLSNDGAGMRLQGATPLLINCTFKENWAGIGRYVGTGAALAAHPHDGPGWSGVLQVIDCRFLDNTAYKSSADYTKHPRGGAVWVGQTDATFVNSLFAGNESGSDQGGYAFPGFGGAIYNAASIVTMVNCTVADNRTPGGGWGGGLATSYSAHTYLHSCIFWGNDAGNNGEGDQIYLTKGDPDAQMTVDYCDVQGGEEEIGGETEGLVWVSETCITEDPGLTAGYRFSDESSPCINTGDTDEIMKEQYQDAYDIDDDGNDWEPLPDLGLSLRVSGGEVDMGSYEYCLADITGNGVVDVVDLIALLDAWGECPDPPQECPADIYPADGEGDGVVDVLDLLMLLNEWGCGVPGGPLAPEGIQDCIDLYGDDFEQMEACIQAIILSQGG